MLKMRGLEKGRNIDSYLHPTWEEARNIGSNTRAQSKKLPFR